MVDAIFQAVWEMSLAAAVAVVVIALFRQAFGRRLPRIFSYALWALVLVRLVVPVALPSAFSIFNALSVPETLLTQSMMQTDRLPGAADGGNRIPAEETVPGNAAASKAAEAEGIPGMADTAGKETAAPSGDVTDRSATGIKLSGDEAGLSAPGTELSGAVTHPAAAADSSAGTARLAHAAARIWLIGAAAFLLLAVCAYIRASRRFREAVLYKNDKPVAASHQLAGLRRRVRVYVSDRAQAPVVCGLMKARIILSPQLAESCSEEELQQILVHELIHIRRFDYLIKPFGLMVLCVHWFNPFVWAAFFLSQKDMELACDEKVISLFERDIRSEYANVLIRLAAKQNLLHSPGLPAFGESNIKSRIKSIMTFRKPGYRVGAAAVILFAAIGAAVLTNGQSGPGNQDTGPDKPAVESEAIQTPSPAPESSPDLGGTAIADQVDKLLEEIQKGGPQLSSNPYDYVNGNEAFAKLTAMGQPALDSMLESLARNNEDGLREYIMAAACARIMGLYNEKTGIGTASGREWFYKYGTFARNEDLRRVDADYAVFRNTSRSNPILLPDRTDMANLEEVIADSILVVNREAYRESEKAVEAHRILGMEEKEGMTFIYLQTSFHWFGFEDGAFTIASGGSLQPVIIKLKKREDGQYEVVEYVRSMDIKSWNDSMRKQFPEAVAAAIENRAQMEQLSGELLAEQIGKARSYLQEIGRSDAPVTVSASRGETDSEGLRAINSVSMLNSGFPDWNGTLEMLVAAGGEAPGTTVRCILQSEYEKTAEGEYIVTLTKTWNLSVNGIQPVSFWKYKVAGEQAELVEKQDNDGSIRLIK
ncbi:MAG: antirepressor regulating drug resistance protein [Paenibacillaceae bacterium]|nr:antirepressor regulating drug resistance protein [Paenibacillaceae bacterium]